MSMPSIRRTDGAKAARYAGCKLALQVRHRRSTGGLTGTLVNHAAVRGIEIEAVESSYTADMDVRGLFGLADDVRKAPNKVRVNMCVKSEADAEELTELAMYSPVYDMVSQSLPVEFTLTTY